MPFPPTAMLLHTPLAISDLPERDKENLKLQKSNCRHPRWCVRKTKGVVFGLITKAKVLVSLPVKVTLAGVVK